MQTRRFANPCHGYLHRITNSTKEDKPVLIEPTTLVKRQFGFRLFTAMRSSSKGTELILILILITILTLTLVFC